MSGLDVDRLTHGAFLVVGVCVFLFGASDLAWAGVNVLSTKGAHPAVPWNYVAEYALRCLFGLALMFGGRGLSGMLLHLRTAGTERG